MKVEADAGDVTRSIDGAVDAADTAVVIEAEATDVTASINGAVDAADTSVVIEADSSSVDALADSAAAASAGMAGVTRSSFGVVGGLKTIGAVVAGVGLGALFTDSISLASALSEQVSGTAVVFGDFAGEIEDASKKAAAASGLARVEYLQTANALGGLIVALGLTKEAASEMAPAIIARAADIASLKDLEVVDVLEKIRSGLVGEVEPLRALGVNFDAAKVEAKAFELGLADANTTVSDAAKVQARLAIIYEQTGIAAGNYAMTADGLANTQRTLTAEWQNAKTAIGEALLPVALDLAKTGREELIPLFTELANSVFPALVAILDGLAPVAGGVLTVITALVPVVQALAAVIQAIPEPLLTAVGTFLALRAAIGPLPELFSQVASRAIAMTAPGALGGMAGALSGTTIAAGGLTLALGAGVAVWSKFKAEQAETRARTMAYADAINKATTATGLNTEALLENIEAALKKSLIDNNQVDDLDSLALGYDEVAAAVAGNDEAYDALIVKIIESLGPLRDMHGQLIDVGAAVRSGGSDYNQLLSALLPVDDEVRGLVMNLDDQRQGFLDGQKEASLLAKVFGDELAPAAEGAAAGVKVLTEAEKKAAEEAKKAAEAIDKLVDAAVEGLPSVADAASALGEKDHLKDFLDKARKNAVDALNFTRSIQTLLARGAFDLAAALQEAGVGAAGVAAEASRASDAALAKAEANVDKSAQIGQQANQVTESNINSLITLTSVGAVRVTNAFQPDFVAPIKAGFQGAGFELAAQMNRLDRGAFEGGEDTGRDYARGLKVGIQNGTAAAVAQAAATARLMNTGARRALLIDSPSKAAIEVGRFYAQGLALGLRASVGVDEAAAALARRAIVRPANFALAVAGGGNSAGPPAAASPAGNAAAGAGLRPIIVNEVASDPRATAVEIDRLLGEESRG